MIKIYTAAYNSSCDRAKAWLHEHHLAFEEIDLMTAPLTDKEILHLISLTEDGIEEIIVKRSMAYQKLKVSLNSLPMSYLVKVIDEDRSILKRPLIVDDKRLQVGYNEENIRKFLPQSVRKVAFQMAKEEVYQNELYTDK